MPIMSPRLFLDLLHSASRMRCLNSCSHHLSGPSSSPKCGRPSLAKIPDACQRQPTQRRMLGVTATRTSPLHSHKSARHARTRRKPLVSVLPFASAVADFGRGASAQFHGICFCVSCSEELPPLPSGAQLISLGVVPLAGKTYMAGGPAKHAIKLAFVCNAAHRILLEIIIPVFTRSSAISLRPFSTPELNSK